MSQSQPVVPDKKSNKRILRNDLLFIFGLLAVISIACAVLFLAAGEGDAVTVSIDGKVYRSYSLSENITVDIRSGENGAGLNVLVIENGEAYVSHASCPDGICSAHKPIKRNGESIICLPNRVVISVNSEKSDAPDIIS